MLAAVGVMQHQPEEKDEQPMADDSYPVTPDGRYFVVRGRLWRCSDPSLPADVRKGLVSSLMDARRAKGMAMRSGDAFAREAARQAVDAAKKSLGERGPVWWSDDAPDLNRHMVSTTPYAEWFASLEGGVAPRGDADSLLE